MMETNKQVLIFGSSSVVLLSVYLFEISLFSIILCLLCGYLGFKSCSWIVQQADGRFFEQQVKSAFTTTNDQQNDGNVSEKIPWMQILVAKPVNDALEQFLEQGVENFVNNWYESAISRDQAFLNEIKYQLRFACCQLTQRVSIEKLKDIIVEEALPLASVHLQKIHEATMDINQQNLPMSLMETEISKRFHHFHYAMSSRANEINYLRQIGEHLVPLLFDDTRLAGRAMDQESPRHEGFRIRAQRGWPSLPSRHLLRELIVQSILLPLLDLIADPDTINYLLILLFDSEISPGGIEDGQEPLRVPLLSGFTESALESLPDSLLQLKLSELIRDARQYSMFRLYLEDTRGPLNELLFVAEADRIHEVMQKKTECSYQIHCDIWQLYGQFVHEGSPERIAFEEEIVTEFRESIEMSDLARLERVLEKSYQWVYSRLQWSHVVPFCQSDSFLGHLCGSPPISLDLISLPQDHSSLHHSVSITEKSFSLAQFRGLFRKFLLLDVEDGAEGGKDHYNQTFNQQPFEVNLYLDGDRLAEHEENPSQRVASMSLASPSASLHSKSMPDFQMPSIDVTSYSMDDIESSPSPVPSAISDLGPDDVQSLDSGMGTGGGGGQSADEFFIIDSENRDIGRWLISIPKIVPDKDPVNGRMMFVYQIQVVRHDAHPHETRTWTVLRKYNEFYVLEAKLNEFHGDSLHIPTLPPRKSFVSKTRAFIDQNRLAFSAFLGNVCKQRQLSRSDLLFAFLASNEEFRDALLLSDLNPWRVVKKMPGKLAREKGQNLRPFLLGMLATTLSSNTSTPLSNHEKKKEDSSSISSLSVENSHSHSYYSSIFGDNFSSSRNGEETIDGRSAECEREAWNGSVLCSLLLLLHSTILTSTSMVGSLLSLIPKFFSITFHFGGKAFINKILHIAFCDQFLIRLVQLVEQSVFCSEERPWPTEQEKSLRSELAKRKFVDWIEDSLPVYLRKMIDERSMRTTALQHLQSLQYPRLNKQLSYVLLDRIVEKIFFE